MAGKEIPVAQVYAKAMLEMGIEQDRLDTFTGEMRAFADLLNYEPRVGLLLNAPDIGDEEKKAGMRRIFTGKASREFLNLLFVLIDKRRTQLLPQIAEAYEELLDVYRGRVHGTVTTAVDISDTDVRRIEELLSHSLGKEVLLRARVDPDVIGGVVVKVGDTVIDSSIRTHLQEIRERMLARHAH